MATKITDPTSPLYDPDARLSTKEVAAYLGLKISRVHQYARGWCSIDLKSERLGASLMFRVADVIEFERQTAQANIEKDRNKVPGKRFQCNGRTRTAALA